MDKIDRVTKYAIDVVEGREIAGEYVKLACQRHLNDLENQNYQYSNMNLMAEKALRIIEYAETLYIAEGEEKFNFSYIHFRLLF